jgi:hypothetical protein
MAYPWSNSTGFGTKYANPATLPNGNSTGGVVFNPSSNVIVATNDNSPYVTAYPWSASTGFGTKYTDPSVGNRPTGAPQDIAFNFDGTAIAVGHNTTPFVTAISWSNSTGFGTKFTNPTTLPPQPGQSVAFGTIYPA